MAPPENIPFDHRRAVPREDVVKTRTYREARPWFGPPSCTDSDGGIAATMADLMKQSTTPGKTTAYVPVSSQGPLAWKKIEGTDGCKTPTLLLEHSCLKKSGALGSAAAFAFHYLPCPTGTTCAVATDAQTGVSGAACVGAPTPPPPPTPSCDPLAPGSWQVIGPATNAMATYVVHEHDGILFAGGIGGVKSWDPATATWHTLSSGFAPPLWMNTPMVVDLATYGDSLYGVHINGGADRVYRWNPQTLAWDHVDAPIEVRSMLVGSGDFFLGTSSSVHLWDPDAGSWAPVGSALDSTVKTLFRDGATLLAGTFAGDVHRFETVANTWSAATPLLPSNYVHTLQRYGDYLYVGAEWALYRCWTETGVWDLGTSCEQIEPETGFGPELSPLDLHVHNGVLHVATSEGVRQFDAATDTWLPLNDGLAILYGAPAHSFSLTTYTGALVVGTLEGVYRWDCE